MVTASFADAFVFPPIAQAILYGMYLATLVHCLRWLIFDDEGWRTRERIKWSMLIISIIIFLLSTTDLGISLWMAIGPAMRMDVLVLVNLGVMVGAIENVSMIIVDAVLIYRCWIVYRRSWRVICLPLLLWLSGLSCAILLTYYSTTVAHSKDAGSALMAYSQICRFVIVFLSSNIGSNIYATSAIIYRILRMARGNGSASARLVNIPGILAESGAIYTFTSALALATNVLRQSNYDLNFLNYLSTSINFTVAGIAFNLIVARIGSNKESRGCTQNTHKVKLMPLLAAVFHVYRDTTGERVGPTNTEKEENSGVGVAGLFVSL